MRVLPLSEYYECRYCDCRFVYLSFWSAFSIFLAGVLGLILVIMADRIGIGNQNGFGMRQALALSIPSYVVFYGLFLLFKK